MSENSKQNQPPSPPSLPNPRQQAEQAKLDFYRQLPNLIAAAEARGDIERAKRLRSQLQAFQEQPAGAPTDLQPAAQNRAPTDSNSEQQTVGSVAKQVVSEPPKRGRKDTPSEEKLKHVLGYLKVRDTTTQENYCKAHGISERSLRAWIREYERGELMPK